jgi:type I restriction enzyme M protein
VSTMQDDVYMLVQDGWKASVNGQTNIDLIPQTLVIDRYFPSQQQILDNIEADRDRITSQVEALCEEYGCEEGLLEDAKNDKGKLSKASVKARLTAIKHESESDEERKLLNEFLELIEQEAAANKKLKDAQKSLEIDVHAKYHTLSESETKDLVVEDKWLRALETGIETELECISQRLTGRISELTERYAIPLSSLELEVESYRLKVGSHLKRMGFDWQAMTSECKGVIA